MILQLLAAISVGSIAAALIAHAGTISNHRQDWINALRDDLAEFQKQIALINEAVSDLAGSPDASESKIREKRARKIKHSLYFIHNRLLLRLNPSEPLHISLAGNLQKALELVRDRTPQYDQAGIILRESQKILKQEWEVAKYGPFTRFIHKLKNLRRAS